MGWSKVSGFALSVSHPLDSSPKGRAFGSPCKLNLYAKASPFGRGVTEGDGEGEAVKVKSCCTQKYNSFP